MLGGGGVKHGLRGSPALCSGGGGRSLQRLLTGIGICERALWESLAARDQLWRDVPTTPTGVAKVGARGGHVASGARRSIARRRRAPCMRVLTRIRESYFHRQLPTHLICTILGPEAAAAYYTIFLSLSSGERLHSAHSSCKMASPQRLPFHSDCLSTATAFPQ
eukprot:COSAG01_NODE_1895_length_8971_cov_127.287083_7_plen_164_part_00